MRPRYPGYARPDAGGPAPIGVLVSNLGTPQAPTAAAVRRYLAEFLWDPRVVELPRPLWWLILNLAVLPLRPRRSARLYAKVWGRDGSPLLVASRAITAGLTARLRERIPAPVHVALGMRYGEPAIRDALRELAAHGCSRILVLPLYPQYSSPTTGSTFDAVAAELAGWRRVPELRTVSSYHDDPAYVAALAASIREAWAAAGAPERLMLSFHGLPQRYVDAGDHYQGECLATARLLRAALDWPQERLVVSFQSRFGRDPWIQPATDATLLRLAGEGAGRVDVVCPGFAADCLETLEEIAITNRERFLAAGGGELRYIPALGARADHLDALAALAERSLAGWAPPLPL